MPCADTTDRSLQQWLLTSPSAIPVKFPIGPGGKGRFNERCPFRAGGCVPPRAQDRVDTKGRLMAKIDASSGEHSPCRLSGVSDFAAGASAMSFSEVILLRVPSPMFFLASAGVELRILILVTWHLELCPSCRARVGDFVHLVIGTCGCKSRFGHQPNPTMLSTRTLRSSIRAMRWCAAFQHLCTGERGSTV